MSMVLVDNTMSYEFDLNLFGVLSSEYPTIPHNTIHMVMRQCSGNRSQCIEALRKFVDVARPRAGSTDSLSSSGSDASKPVVTQRANYKNETRQLGAYTGVYPQLQTQIADQASSQFCDMRLSDYSEQHVVRQNQHYHRNKAEGAYNFHASEENVHQTGQPIGPIPRPGNFAQSFPDRLGDIHNSPNSVNSNRSNTPVSSHTGSFAPMMDKSPSYDRHQPISVPYGAPSYSPGYPAKQMTVTAPMSHSAALRVQSPSQSYPYDNIFYPTHHAMGMPVSGISPGFVVPQGHRLSNPYHFPHNRNASGHIVHQYTYPNVPSNIYNAHDPRYSRPTHKSQPILENQDGQETIESQPPPVPPPSYRHVHAHEYVNQPGVHYSPYDMTQLPPSRYPHSPNDWPEDPPPPEPHRAWGHRRDGETTPDHRAAPVATAQTVYRRSSAGEDPAYLNTLLERQMLRRQKMKEEWQRHSQLLERLKRDVNRLKTDLMNKEATAEDVRQKKQENDKLECAIRLLTQRIDIVTPEGSQVKLGDLESLNTQESFYHNLPRGQSVDYGQHSQRAKRVAPPPPVPTSSQQVRRVPPARPPPPRVPDPPVELWKCSECTFDNHPLLQKCEICEYPRKINPP